MVVGAAPVRHYHAVKSPLTPEDIFQQMFIFICIRSVYLIITGHQGFGSALFYCNLKSGQIDFPQSALVNHGVHCHPPEFLAVDRKVLRAGRHALALNAPDVGRGHFPRLVWVFGKIFEIPAAERAALHIQARS